MMTNQNCLICCEGLNNASTSFTADSDLASCLCNVLRIAHEQKPSGLSTAEDDDEDEGQTCLLSSLFQRATFCPSCLSRVQELSVILKEFIALERKLIEGGKLIEEDLRRSFDNTALTRRSRRDKNQKIREQVIYELTHVAALESEENSQIQDETNNFKPEPIDQDGEIDFDSILSGVYNKFDEVYAEQTGNVPPSPTHSFGGAASDDYEEKFDPSSLDTSQTSCDPGTPPESQSRKPHLKSARRPRNNKGKSRNISDDYSDSSGSNYRPDDPDWNSNDELVPVRKKQKKPPLAIPKDWSWDMIKEKAPEVAATSESKIAEEVGESGNPEQPSNLKSKTGRRKGPKRVRLNRKRDGGVPRIPCPIPGCGFTFKNDQELRLKAHVKRIHQGVKKCYTCEECGKSFHNSASLELHQMDHQGIPRRFQCDECGNIYKHPAILHNHIVEKHQPEKFKFECHCGRRYIDEKAYALHVESHDQTFLCEICSEVFETNKQLCRHKTNRHSDQAPLPCPDCEKTFRKQSYLKDHMNLVHKKIFKYQCELCGYGAVNMNNFRKHVVIHTGERNYACEVCGQRFKEGTALKIHSRKHTGERPYVCSVCSKGFVDSTKLKRHELLHSDEERFGCELCGKRFKVKDYLNYHMKTTHYSA